MAYSQYEQFSGEPFPLLTDLYAPIDYSLILMPTFESPAAPSPNSQFLSKFQVTIPKPIASLAADHNEETLPDTFQPTDYDVVMGRGKGSYNRIGNRRYRDIVKSHIPEYLATKSRFEKSNILNSIIDEVKALDGGRARFIKSDGVRSWRVISNEMAREKIGHTIREAIAELKKSSQAPKASLNAAPVPGRRPSKLQQKAAMAA